MLACACLCEGEFGVNGLIIGVPAVVGGNGVEKIYTIKLTEEEQAMLDTTTAAVQKSVDEAKDFLAKL